MNQHTLQHGFTTGRQLWLVVALALGLTLSTQAAAAKECARETPLPTEVHLIAPGAEVPEDIAWFAGIWSGEAVGDGRSLHHAGRRRGVGQRVCSVIVSVAPLPPWTSSCRGSCAPPPSRRRRPARAIGVTDPGSPSHAHLSLRGETLQSGRRAMTGGRPLRAGR